jgi:hypothetical protein
VEADEVSAEINKKPPACFEVFSGKSVDVLDFAVAPARCTPPSGCVANFAQKVMQGQLPLSIRGLRCEGVEQFGRSKTLILLLDDHLPFLDHMHEFHTS